MTNPVPSPEHWRERHRALVLQTLCDFVTLNLASAGTADIRVSDRDAREFIRARLGFVSGPLPWKQAADIFRSRGWNTSNSWAWLEATSPRAADLYEDEDEE